MQKYISFTQKKERARGKEEHWKMKKRFSLEKKDVNPYGYGSEGRRIVNMSGFIQNGPSKLLLFFFVWTLSVFIVTSILPAGNPHMLYGSREPGPEHMAAIDRENIFEQDYATLQKS